MKRNKWNKDIDLMVRIMGQGRHPVFYQEIIKRIKLNFVSTPGAVFDILGYLSIGTKAGEWELVENKIVEADIVKFCMSKKVKELLHYTKHAQLLEGSNYKIVDNLGRCRFLELRAMKCKRPYSLTPKMDLLATEREILILTLVEAPQFRLVDDFIKEIRALSWMINELIIG